jgi:hypothetical protein
MGPRGPIPEALLYDPGEGSFLVVPMRRARFDHSATRMPGRDGLLETADDRVLIAGGCDGREILSHMEIFIPDPDGDGDWSDSRFEKLPLDLPCPRARHSALLVARRNTRISSPFHRASEVFFFGGLTHWRGENIVIGKAEILALDPDGDGDSGDSRMVHLAQPLYVRVDHSATLLPGPDGVCGTFDDMIFLYGGFGCDPFCPPPGAFPMVVLGEGEMYEFLTDSWALVRQNSFYPEQPQLSKIPGRADLRGRSGSPMGVHARRGIIGPRMGHRAVLLADGRVLIVGGSNGCPGGAGDIGGGIRGNDRVRRAELFMPNYRDPSQGRFSPSRPLRFLRRDPELSRLPDGRVFVTGGYDGLLDRVVAGGEIFDPSDCRFHLARQALQVERIFHTQTLSSGADGIRGSSDDRIIIIGGLDNRREPRAAIEFREGEDLGFHREPAEKRWASIRPE